MFDFEEELKDSIFNLYVLIGKKVNGSCVKLIHGYSSNGILEHYNVVKNNPDFADFELFRFAISQDGIDYCQSVNPENL